MWRGIGRRGDVAVCAAEAPASTGLDADALALPLIGPVDDAHLHVMSFNLRRAGREPHRWRKWRHRVRHIGHLLGTEQPTIIGTQEGTIRQVAGLLHRLRAGSGDRYRVVRRGRGRYGTGETCGIFYDSRRLAQLAAGHLWFSDTPNVPGSTGWGNDFPRMMTWVRFRDRLTDRTFLHVNAHLDHRSGASRRKSAELIRRTVAEWALPTIVTGDFNCEPGSAPHDILLADGMHDTWSTKDARVTRSCDTTNGWCTAPRDTGHRIDWIIGTSRVHVARVGINHWYPQTFGHVISDHWPVQAEIWLD